MIDWTKPIEDKTKDSRLWKARGKEGVHGGCYICGSTEHAKEYAFGRLHITTLERHITADSRLATTKQYSYAPPVRRYLCDDCLRWEYQNRIVKRDFALFLFFGILFLVFGIVLACFGGFSSSDDYERAVLFGSCRISGCSLLATASKKIIHR